MHGGSLKVKALTFYCLLECTVYLNIYIVVNYSLYYCFACGVLKIHWDAGPRLEAIDGDASTDLAKNWISQVSGA